MLILILGPSGAGKTTVIEELVALSHWRPITSYITRPARAADKFKNSIGLPAYQLLQASNSLFSDIGQLNHRYGLLKADVHAAINSPTPHITDFSFRQRNNFFARVPHAAFAVVPESGDELVRRLSAEGRANRIQGALQDLADLEGEVAAADKANTVKLILNERDRATEAARQILAYIENPGGH